MHQTPLLSAAYVFTINFDYQSYEVITIIIFHFMDQETKTQKGYITFPNSLPVRNRIGMWSEADWIQRPYSPPLLPAAS